LIIADGQGGHVLDGLLLGGSGRLTQSSDDGGNVTHVEAAGAAAGRRPAAGWAARHHLLGHLQGLGGQRAEPGQGAGASRRGPGAGDIGPALTAEDGTADLPQDVEGDTAALAAPLAAAGAALRAHAGRHCSGRPAEHAGAALAAEHVLQATSGWAHTALHQRAEDVERVHRAAPMSR